MSTRALGVNPSSRVAQLAGPGLKPAYLENQLSSYMLLNYIDGPEYNEVMSQFGYAVSFCLSVNR